MKFQKLFPIIPALFLFVGCGSSNPATVSQLTTESVDSQHSTESELSTEAVDSYVPECIKNATDIQNQSVLKNSSSFSSCITDALVHVGSPSIKKMTYATLDKSKDDGGNESWNVNVYIRTDYADYSLAIIYYLKSDDAQCTMISNWHNDHVYWVSDRSSFSGTLYDYITDKPESETETESETDAGSIANNKIDGVFVDYRGDFSDDVTGNWRLSTVLTEKSIDEYAFDYYKSYFNSDDEIHWIVNYSDNTTSCINCINGYLSITEYSHVDGEESSAKKIGSGSHISDFLISAEDGSPADF